MVSKPTLIAWTASSAVGALIGAFGYLVLTGGTVPTQRAFIMLGIILLAVLVDRVAITMRLVAEDLVHLPLVVPATTFGVRADLEWQPRLDGYIRARDARFR